MAAEIKVTGTSSTGTSSTGTSSTEAREPDVSVPTTGERSADGITVEIDTVAGPVAIVRTTQKSVTSMQHC